MCIRDSITKNLALVGLSQASVSATASLDKPLGLQASALAGSQAQAAVSKDLAMQAQATAVVIPLDAAITKRLALAAQTAASTAGAASLVKEAAAGAIASAATLARAVLIKGINAAGQGQAGTTAVLELRILLAANEAVFAHGTGSVVIPKLLAAAPDVRVESAAFLALRKDVAPEPVTAASQGDGALELTKPFAALLAPSAQLQARLIRVPFFRKAQVLARTAQLSSSATYAKPVCVARYRQPVAELLWKEAA